nr:MAG TPA: hypothetical protein [Herelleviridae sp.]
MALQKRPAYTHRVSSYLLTIRQTNKRGYTPLFMLSRSLDNLFLIVS